MPSATIRLGLVGLAWGERVAAAAACAPYTALDACFARTPAAREAFARRHGCRATSSFEEMIYDDSIDAIALMTPNGTHHRLALAALNAGKHVLVTKPIATKLQDAAEMIVAAKSSGRLLAVAHQSRRQAGVRQLKHLLTAGRLGRPVSFEGNTSSPKAGNMPSSSWRRSAVDCPGGPLLQLGIHFIDNAQYLLGPVTTVSSRHQSDGENAPTDTTVSWLRFAGGVVGTLVSSFASESIRWIRIAGEKGCATFHGSRGLWLELPGRDPEVVVAPRSAEQNLADALAEELAEFGECVRAGRRPETGGRTGARNLAVVLAAVESHRTGRPVDVEEFIDGQGCAGVLAAE